MGSLTFDFLKSSLLFDEDHLADAFSRIPVARLEQELQRYREFCADQRDALVEEVAKSGSRFRIFPGIERDIDFDLLKQSALYVEQFVFDDPLFVASRRNHPQGRVVNQAIGMPERELDRRAVAAASMQMLRLQSAVASNLVKFLPFSSIVEPAAETPILYSEDRFASSLPPEIIKLFRARVRVSATKRIEAGYRVEKRLYPTRSIHVGFRDASFRDSRSYHLFAHEVLSMDEASRTVEFAMRLPDEPPNREEFEAWVDQSINQTARSVYQHLRAEWEVAADLGAQYLTTSPFIHDVLMTTPGHQSSAATHTANALLSLDLPFLAGLSLDDIVHVRSEYALAFQAFRNSLDERLKELEDYEDPAQRRSVARKIARQLAETDVRSLGETLKSARASLTTDAVIAAASLVAAIPTSSPWTVQTVAGGLGAVLAGVKTVRDLKRSGRDSAAFFLWKLQGRRK